MTSCRISFPYYELAQATANGIPKPSAKKIAVTRTPQNSSMDDVFVSGKIIFVAIVISITPMKYGRKHNNNIENNCKMNVEKA